MEGVIPNTVLDSGGYHLRVILDMLHWLLSDFARSDESQLSPALFEDPQRFPRSSWIFFMEWRWSFHQIDRHDYQTNFLVFVSVFHRNLSTDTSSTYYSDIIHVNHISSGNSHQCLSIFIHPLDFSPVSMLETAGGCLESGWRAGSAEKTLAPIQAWCWPIDA